MTIRNLLFLCTGNYYRSRFAEHLFNHLAQGAGLAWRADSRGLALERGAHNVGPMSRDAASALDSLGISVNGDERMPQSATALDFAVAERVIALDETEHRPLMEERFPEQAATVEYWLIHDLDRTDADSALAQIQTAVRDLVDGLRTGCGTP